MIIEVNEKFLGELKHTAVKLRQAQKALKEPMLPLQAKDIDNDIKAGYTLLEAIVESVEKGVEARQRVINREGHTHVVLTCFCFSNEWLGEQE